MILLESGGAKVGPTSAAHAAAAAIGLALALLTLPWSFFSGASTYWDLGHADTLHGMDAVTALTGLRLLLATPWGWPLLHMAEIGPPGGTNAAYMDVLPGIALLLKMAASIPGAWVPNPYGWWALACLVTTPVAAMRVAWLLGARGIPAAAAVATVSACFPPLLGTVVHVSLLAHFVPLFALELALRRLGGDARPVAEALLLPVAALLHPYLAAFAAVPLASAPLAALWARSWRRAVSAATPAAVGAAAAVVVFVVLGVGHEPNVKPLRLWGYYSLDLLSPFWPYPSLLAPKAGPASLREGHHFLGMWPGAGGLALVCVALAHLAGSARGRSSARGRGAPMLALMLGSAFFAVTTMPSVAGHPLPFGFYPEPLAPVLETLRASGRFFWLPLWLAMLYGAAVLARGGHGMDPRRALAALALIVAAQVADTLPGRWQAAESVRPPSAAAVGDAASIQGLLAGASRISVHPPHDCAADPHIARATVELAAMAAAAKRTTDSVRTARIRTHCRDADNLAANPSPVPGTLRIFLRPAEGTPPMAYPGGVIMPPWTANCPDLPGANGMARACPPG